MPCCDLREDVEDDLDGVDGIDGEEEYNGENCELGFGYVGVAVDFSQRSVVAHFGLEDGAWIALYCLFVVLAHATLW